MTLLIFMFEYVVWISHVRQLYFPPNVCNCRCVDASSVAYTDFRIFTCESRSSQSVHLSGRGMPSLCKICNSKSFLSILFKLCLMVVHILKMCTSFLCTIYEYFLIFEGCWTEAFFRRKMLRWCLGCVICNSNSFYSFILKLFIRIGLQKRFQNFKQRASKGIQIGSVVFVAIFSWRRERKKNTVLQIKMRNWQLILTHLGYSKRTVSPFREQMFELMVKKIQCTCSQILRSKRMIKFYYLRRRIWR